MKRRDFFALLGGATAWPLTAHGQRAVMPVIGFLNSASPAGFAARLQAFNDGLGEVGYVAGHNVRIEYRWAEGQFGRLSSLAADLVQHQVSVLVATGSANSAQVAKATTSTIPIVFANGGDPITDGVVASLNRPEANVTGVTFISNLLTAKRLGLLRELIPAAEAVAILNNPASVRANADTLDAQEAARALRERVIVLNAANEREIEEAFGSLAQQRASAVIVNADGFFRNRAEQLVALAARYSVAVVYADREYALAGGLMSYGPSITDGYRQAGVYTGKILKGTKPSDLPVQQPTKFEFVINLKTAKALGLTFPPGLLAIADEVIE